MPTADKNVTSAIHSEVSGALSNLAAAQSSAPSSRRSSGENRAARNSRLIAEVSIRLSEIMKFGDLEDSDLYTIGQLADYLDVSLRTLRFYEQSGLLRPVREGSRRLYTRRDLDQLRVIVTLRELEASLGAIKSLMTRIKDLDDVGSMMAAIEGLLVAIAASNDERIGELTRLNGRINETLGQLQARGGNS